MLCTCAHTTTHMEIGQPEQVVLSTMWVSGLAASIVTHGALLLALQRSLCSPWHLPRLEQLARACSSHSIVLCPD